MEALLLVALAGAGFIIAYHTYSRWLGSKIFRLSAEAVCPSRRFEDGADYVPTTKAVVFGHHFTSIAGTGPIVGPAIAVMWGWLPALLWVVLGSIFIGAVHDFGSLVVSLRNNGQTIGDIAGRLMNQRVRLLFLFILFVGLTIVLAIFGLVIASVFRQYPASIFPCLVQIPIAIAIGLWLHRRGASLLAPSLIALALMYLTVIYGDTNNSTDIAWLAGIERALHSFNSTLAGWSNITWVILLLAYSYIASVLPVWSLLQPRDYINSLQLVSALGLIVIGLVAAAFIGGAPPIAGAERQPLEIVAPMWNPDPAGAPLIFPFLFITIACGAISGFHCLVSSGTSSKQLASEPEARFVGYGGMLTEGFLATLVIIACVAGLGLGQTVADGRYITSSGEYRSIWLIDGESAHIFRGDHSLNSRNAIQMLGTVAPGYHAQHDLYLSESFQPVIVGRASWNTRYESWTTAGGLAATVGAFVDGSANFLRAIGIPGGVAVALMGVLVASFAGTTMDTACRLQRYVIQELAATFLPRSKCACPNCGHTILVDAQRRCPECGEPVTPEQIEAAGERLARGRFFTLNPLLWLSNKHGATLFAVITATILAALPLVPPGSSLGEAFRAGGFSGGVDWLTKYTGTGGLILWPLFGATNQLLGGLAFMVIAFYLRRRGKPLWFLVVPMIFMLIMPMWAMIAQIFAGDTSWIATRRWILVTIGLAAIVLELWMIVEAALMFPRVRGVLESGAVADGLGEFDALDRARA